MEKIPNLKRIEVKENFCYNDDYYCYFLENKNCRERDKEKYRCIGKGKNYIFIEE
jgi:hypothetical protein